jgi:hypothetical protein
MKVKRNACKQKTNSSDGMLDSITSKGTTAVDY